MDHGRGDFFFFSYVHSFTLAMKLIVSDTINNGKPIYAMTHFINNILIWSYENNEIISEIQCANFTVENAEIVIHSLDYLGTATITCHSDYLTDYGRKRVDVYCQADKTWSEDLACTGKIYQTFPNKCPSVHVNLINMVRKHV